MRRTSNNATTLPACRLKSGSWAASSVRTCFPNCLGVICRHRTVAPALVVPSRQRRQAGGLHADLAAPATLVRTAAHGHASHQIEAVTPNIRRQRGSRLVSIIRRVLACTYSKSLVLTLICFADLALQHRALDKARPLHCLYYAESA
eukprot:6171899-Pleurochrysis_carterae.AAC.4